MKLKVIIAYLSLLLLVTTSAKGLAVEMFTRPFPDLPPVIKFDEFTGGNCEMELARMDNFAIELQSNPDKLGYIIVYGGRTGSENEAKAYAARMRFYLTRTRNLDGRRLFTIEGGYRETLTTELWLGASGLRMPTPTPTVSSKDVKLKGRMRVRGYNCGATSWK